jgi:dihydrolipoamide dehydrogenase
MVGVTRLADVSEQSSNTSAEDQQPETQHYDVIVLGAGPGGYVAAIRAAQLGKSVAVIEKKYWGGVCLNVGCIPSKALLRNAELAHVLTHEKDVFGIQGEASMAFGPTHERSRKVSAGIVRGVHFLMKKNKITEIDGWGTLTGPPSDGGSGRVDVELNDGSRASYTYTDLIIGTGATTRLIPGTTLSERVVTYEEQILDPELPGSVIIAGSGAIGVEFAYVLVNFGVDVTIVEFLDRMVPTEDADVSKELLKHYKKLGVKVLLGTRVESISDSGAESGEKVKVTVSKVSTGSSGEAESEVLEADKVLQAIGFAPRLEGYGLESLGVATERGAIVVDEFCRTNVEHVYAIGDVTASLMLAHVAEAMGIVAAETIGGVETMPVAYDFVPRATYCQPQIASFGYSEAQAKEKGYDVKTATFPFSANGKAQGLGEAVGFVKVVADAEYNEILGAHLIGPDVTELLPVLTLAQKWDLTADEVARNVFAHPTLTEAVKEAVHGIAGHMINL